MFRMLNNSSDTHDRTIRKFTMKPNDKSIEKEYWNKSSVRF